MDSNKLAVFKNGKADQFDLLYKALNSFESISLEEMKGANLMDRVDTKYILNRHQLPFFLSWLNGAYRVLEINQHRSITYESVYFDTTNFNLFRHHHCGKLNRFKIRYRNYAENNLSFFEIKHKTNKGRTVKSRMSSTKVEDSIFGTAKEFLEDNSPLLAADLRAVLWIKYKRITLVNNTSNERVTIDTDIGFKNKHGIESIFPFVVAEVKQEKSSSSEFTRLMAKNSIREGVMSKYCFGISSLESSLKKNNFKMSLSKYYKLKQHDFTDLK